MEGTTNQEPPSLSPFLNGDRNDITIATEAVSTPSISSDGGNNNAAIAPDGGARDGERSNSR